MKCLEWYKKTTIRELNLCIAWGGDPSRTRCCNCSSFIEQINKLVILLHVLAFLAFYVLHL